MADVVRCPHCGASNPAAATWCGQCLRRFDERVAAEQAPPAAMPASPETTAEPALPTPRKLAAVPEPRRGIRREGAAVFWTCPACDNENPMELLTCAVCGTPLARLFEDAPVEEAATGPRSRAVAIALSAALPGAGHGYLGMPGAAVGRGVLYLWTIGIGFLLTVRHVRRASGVMHGLGILFLLAAAAVWMLSYAEVLRISRGDRTPLVPSRTLTWATAGLIFVLFAGLAVIAQTR